MKSALRALPLFSLLFLGACDAPRSKRFVPKKDTTYYTSSSPFGGFNTGSSTSGGTTSGGTTSGSGTGSGSSSTPVTTPESTSSSNVPADAAHCSWSTDGVSGFQYNHSHLGDYSFCRSSQSETTVYVQVKQSFSSPPLCIIPTTNFGGSSTYIGEPRCLYPSKNTTIYKIVLYKNRFNYTNFPLTGAMLMKDEIHQYGGPYNNQYLLTPDAYMYCIDMLSQSSEYCAEFQKQPYFIYHPLN